MDFSNVKPSKNLVDKTGERVWHDVGKTIAHLMLELGIEEKMPEWDGKPDVYDGYGRAIRPPFRVDSPDMKKMIRELEREILKPKSKGVK